MIGIQTKLSMSIKKIIFKNKKWWGDFYIPKLQNNPLPINIFCNLQALSHRIFQPKNGVVDIEFQEHEIYKIINIELLVQAANSAAQIVDPSAVAYIDPATYAALLQQVRN